MATLGNLGNFYVVLLFLLLIGGIGVLALNFSKKFWSSSEKWIDKKGGKLMDKWFKLAAISFVGVLIASFALGLIGTIGGGADAATGGMAGMTGMSGASGTGGTGGTGDAAGAGGAGHLGHHPDGQQNGTDATGAVPAGYSQGMNNMGNNAGLNSTGFNTAPNNLESQMYMMQTNIMRMQQQIGYMMQLYSQQNYVPGPMSVPGNMNGSAGMNNMGSGGGSAGMNMGGSSSMNSQSNFGGSSGGGMGMM